VALPAARSPAFRSTSTVLSAQARTLQVIPDRPHEVTHHLFAHPEVLAEVCRALADVNRRVSRAEQVKRFTVLPLGWTVESEELTPTLKVRRRVVDRRYSSEIDAMYAEPPAGHPVEELVVAG
jgi:long-subunit acyl-CoA synthetase (AMP-forming)